MTPYHHTFHPVRRVDGRMIVAGEDEWTLIEDMNTAYGMEGTTCRVLIGAEVFGEWEGPLFNADGEEVGDWENTGPLTMTHVQQQLFELIADCPHVTFCIETDRPGVVAKMMPPVVTNMRIIDEMKRAETWQGEAYRPNLWLGVGPIRTQAEADRLIPELLKVPAEVRYVVWQPTEDIDVAKSVTGKCPDCEHDLDLHSATSRCSGCSAGDGSEENPLCLCRTILKDLLGWLIIRGGDEPMHPDHVRSLVNQAEAADVPCWLEWGEWAPWGAAKIASGWQRKRINGSKIYGTLHNHEFSMGYRKIVLFHGEEFETFHVVEPGGQDYISFVRVGRDRSGSTLDGREWKMVPGVKS